MIWPHIPSMPPCSLPLPLLEWSTHFQRLSPYRFGSYNYPDAQAVVSKGNDADCSVMHAHPAGSLSPAVPALSTLNDQALDKRSLQSRVNPRPTSAPYSTEAGGIAIVSLGSNRSKDPVAPIHFTVSVQCCYRLGSVELLALLLPFAVENLARLGEKLVVCRSASSQFDSNFSSITC